VCPEKPKRTRKRKAAVKALPGSSSIPALKMGPQRPDCAGRLLDLLIDIRHSPGWETSLPGGFPADSKENHEPCKTVHYRRRLRKIGTTAVAAGLIGIFLGEHRILTALALSVGVVIWSTGIYLTQEES
jgi:hypothetical protein